MTIGFFRDDYLLSLVLSVRASIMDKKVLNRNDFARPIPVAVFFTFLGEVLMYFIWSVGSTPAEVLWSNLSES